MTIPLLQRLTRSLRHALLNPIRHQVERVFGAPGGFDVGRRRPVLVPVRIATRPERRGPRGGGHR